jgi:hypothetical protein
MPFSSRNLSHDHGTCKRNVKVSRPESDILLQLITIPCLEIEKAKVHKDIGLYIEWRMETEESLMAIRQPLK